MFAVPGWNVSAKSLAQEQPSRSGLTQTPKTGSQTSDSKRRKRARNDAETSRKIGGFELEKLWNQRFGEKATREPQKRDRLKSKLESTDDGTQDQTSQKKKPRSLDRDDEQNVSARARSEKQKKDKKQKHKHERRDQPPSSSNNTNTPPSHLIPPQPPPPTTAPSNLTPLQLKMRNKLTSARFRHLNQTLYTSLSSTALSLFTTSPDLFSEYHAGFIQQVQSSWPTNPIDTFISSVRTRGQLPQPKLAEPPLPRRKTLSCTIADLGCGDAPFARALIPSARSLHLTIHSYDLHAPNKHVTVADIAKLPLREGEADIAIFCLSLMGTNWIDFIEEAWRILRGDGKGELWIAEVKSRFGRRKDGVVEHSVGKQRKKQAKKDRNGGEEEDEMVGEELFASSVRDRDETEGDTTDIKPFVSVLQRRGFALQGSSVDKSNKMFVSMIFHKSGVPTAGKYKGWKWNGKEYAKQQDEKVRFTEGDDDDQISKEEGKVLKPCVYKSR